MSKLHSKKKIATRHMVVEFVILKQMLAYEASMAIRSFSTKPKRHFSNGTMVVPATGHFGPVYTGAVRETLRIYKPTEIEFRRPFKHKETTVRCIVSVR